MPAPTLTRSLRHKNYRLYVCGQMVSLTGSWMQSVAQAWLVYRLTGSSLALGLAGFASQVPVFLFALFGGVLADRHPKRGLLILAQALALGQAALLAWLTLSGLVEVWHVMVLALVLGTVNALEIPTRHSFVVEMVGKEDLHNAIALNASMFHFARIIGPGLAGFVVALVGEGWCFLVNAASFLAVIASLACMRLGPAPPRAAPSSVAAHLGQGVRFAWSTPRVRSILTLVSATSVLGASYYVLLPVFAGEVFGRGPEGLGLLTASAGAGSLAGSLMMASRSGPKGLARLCFLATLGLGVSLAVFAASPGYWVAVVCVAPTGFTLMSLMASCNTMLQVSAPDELRGRVMSLYSMVYMGMAPFGAFLAGAVAQWIGAPATVAVMGACCVLIALGPGRAVGRAR